MKVGLGAALFGPASARIRQGERGLPRAQVAKAEAPPRRRGRQQPPRCGSRGRPWPPRRQAGRVRVQVIIPERSCRLASPEATAAATGITRAYLASGKYGCFRFPVYCCHATAAPLTTRAGVGGKSGHVGRAPSYSHHWRRPGRRARRPWLAARRLVFEARITLIGEEPRAPYQRLPLSKASPQRRT